MVTKRDRRSVRASGAAPGGPPPPSLPQFRAKLRGLRRWPPRLPGQPIFYPVTNERYATEITRRWNVPEAGAGHVTRFKVRKSFAERYEIRCVGSDDHTEWWIPAEDLDSLNDNVVGPIEVIASFYAT